MSTSHARGPLAVVLALAIMSGACATAGKNPGYVRCKGKAVIEVVAKAMGFGGSSTFNADCGQGFSLDQGETLPAAVK